MTTNHPAHGPVSLERLSLNDAIAHADERADALSGPCSAQHAQLAAWLRELQERRKADAVKVIDDAIAAFGAEPVGTFRKGPCGYYASFHEDAVPLYTAPPAPVVPETLPCAVELKSGLIIGKGCKTETLLVALQRRADYCAEIDAMTPEERAEHDANIEAFKAMLPTPDIDILSSALRNAQLAPSDNQGRPRAPVAPEECKEAPAYVKALTKEGAYIYGFNACRAAMLQLYGNSEQLDEVGSWNNHRNTPTAQAGNSPVIGIDLASEPDRSVEVRYLAPPGYVIVPIVPTEDMIINGFESVPDPHFSDEKEWEEYEALSGCRQAARRAELCWAAMIKAAPKQENI